MPEGDTIHRTAARLRPALVGHRLVSFDAARLSGAVPELGELIEAVDARGKHLEMRFEGGLVLHTHMRMSGSWHLYRPLEQWRRPARQARVVLEVEGWVAVCFNAPVVELYRAADRRRHPGVGGVGHLGPDLCLAGVDLDVAVQRMSAYCDDGTEIGEALLDQRIACGIGNVYKCEALWACGVDPFTPVSRIDADLRRRLYATAAQQLQANLDGERRTTVPGGLAVYGRAGKPCRRCRAPVSVKRQGEQARVTYWCPGCQRVPDEEGSLASGPIWT